MAADHEFGSQDTDLKLSLVEAYLKQFAIALRPPSRRNLPISCSR